MKKNIVYVKMSVRSDRQERQSLTMADVFFFSFQTTDNVSKSSVPAHCRSNVMYFQITWLPSHLYRLLYGMSLRCLPTTNSV